MASVDVGVGLLRYETVGSSVHRLLGESADEIEHVTGHHLPVVRALVRHLRRERGSGPTVIVWAEPPRTDAVAVEPTRRFVDHDVRRLPVAAEGAGSA